MCFLTLVQILPQIQGNMKEEAVPTLEMCLFKMAPPLGVLGNITYGIDIYLATYEAC